MPTPHYAAPSSACLSLPGFKPVDEYPIRSPLMAADFLAPLVRGKNFCEIGTRNGDIMSCVNHFAATVTAIELDEVYCKKLRERGFNVFCKPFESLTPKEFAHCDVYFWWPMDARSQNEAWLRIVRKAHRELQKPARAIVAHDTHYKFDMQMLPLLATRYDGNITRIFFDEHDPTAPIDGPAPSYKHTFVDRPGRWGVFHMADFELGPGVGGGGHGKGGSGKGRGRGLGRGLR